MSGHELFESLVKGTGLPENYVRARFERIIADRGGTIADLQVDQVRNLLADLLLELINDTLIEPS